MLIFLSLMIAEATKYFSISHRISVSWKKKTSLLVYTVFLDYLIEPIKLQMMSSMKILIFLLCSFNLIRGSRSFNRMTSKLIIKLRFFLLYLLCFLGQSVTCSAFTGGYCSSDNGDPCDSPDYCLPTNCNFVQGTCFLLGSYGPDPGFSKYQIKHLLNLVEEIFWITNFFSSRFKLLSSIEWMSV